MRLSTLFLTAAAASLAVAAAAQDPETPGESVAQPAESEAPAGLSDLEETVRELEDEEAAEPAPRLETEPLPPPESEPAPPPAEPPPATPEQPATAPQEPATAPTEPATAPEQPATAPQEPATAPTQPAPPPPPLTRAQTAELDRNVARGRQLAAIARAGIIATQDMLSRVSDPEAAGISGWVAEPEGNAMRVTFYATGDGDPRAVYRTTVLGGRVTSRETFLTGERPALAGAQARMAAARIASESADQSACNSLPFNVLVVPPAAAGAPIDVYRITVPAGPGRFPLGGHFRSTVAADGTVAESRGFTNACVDFEAGETPAGQPARPVGVAHLLDPMPTEIHVFLSLWSGRPLLVTAGEPPRLWLVTGERIAEVRQ